jgi:hypothetical protein
MRLLLEVDGQEQLIWVIEVLGIGTLDRGVTSVREYLVKVAWADVLV